MSGDDTNGHGLNGGTGNGAEEYGAEAGDHPHKNRDQRERKKVHRSFGSGRRGCIAHREAISTRGNGPIPSLLPHIKSLNNPDHDCTRYQ